MVKDRKGHVGLIENKFAAQNKENLVSYLKSLKSMQMAIEESCSSVEDMKKAMELAPETEGNISGQYNNYENMTKNVPF